MSIKRAKRVYKAVAGDAYIEARKEICPCCSLPIVNKIILSEPNV